MKITLLLQNPAFLIIVSVVKKKKKLKFADCSVLFRLLCYSKHYSLLLRTYCQFLLAKNLPILPE